MVYFSEAGRRLFHDGKAFAYANPVSHIAANDGQLNCSFRKGSNCRNFGERATPPKFSLRSPPLLLWIVLRHLDLAPLKHAMDCCDFTAWRIKYIAIF